MDRETLEVDVLFVGAGPGSLAGALRLAWLAEQNGISDLTILVVEKSREVGSHGLSGAIVDPAAFDELLQGITEKRPPYDAPVTDEAFYLLGKRRAFRSPVTPPPLKNHGNYVASIGKVVRWMAELCEENGVEVYPEFPAVQLLFDGERVIGARIGDKGLDRDGQSKANHEPGIDVLAKVTVLGEGPRGTLARQAERRLGLAAESNPQIYSIGVKELWQVPREIQPGIVYHTLGYPLGTEGLGGGFIYTMEGNIIDVGFVAPLDSEDPRADGHLLFQTFKTHPFVSSLLDGGKVLCYGAKAIPEGGCYSMPKLFSDGLLLVGDSAGFLNAQRLKGIHLAVKSGLMAAETIIQALKAEDYSSRTLGAYSKLFEESWAKKELWKVRNFRQAFQSGFWPGMLHSAFQFLSRGRGLKDPLSTVEGHQRMRKKGGLQADAKPISFDGQLTFDKLTDVFFSDTAHEEDQPCHLKIEDLNICNDRCKTEYGNPCQHFCPAQVYEMVPDDGDSKLQVNFTNCVHCKTCDIADPYQIITWTPPEGGGGPDYKNM